MIVSSSVDYMANRPVTMSLSAGLRTHYRSDVRLPILSVAGRLLVDVNGGRQLVDAIVVSSLVEEIGEVYGRGN